MSLALHVVEQEVGPSQLLCRRQKEMQRTYEMLSLIPSGSGSSLVSVPGRRVPSFTSSTAPPSSWWSMSSQRVGLSVLRRYLCSKVAGSTSMASDESETSLLSRPGASKGAVEAGKATVWAEPGAKEGGRAQPMACVLAEHLTSVSKFLFIP